MDYKAVKYSTKYNGLVWITQKNWVKLLLQKKKIIQFFLLALVVIPTLADKGNEVRK